MNFPIDKFAHTQTPFYFYDIELLRQTLGEVSHLAEHYDFAVHFAVKANANPRILDEVRSYGLGIDVRKAAEKKFQEINDAYDKIKKQRGMN